MIFSHLIFYLNTLLLSIVKFQWHEEREVGICKLELMTKNYSRPNSPIPDEEFVIYSDVSKKGLIYIVTDDFIILVIIELIFISNYLLLV